jgi:hypothetical protein
VATERKPHLYVKNTATTESYRYPKKVRGSSRVNLPLRDRAHHGRKLKEDLAAVRTQLAELARERTAVGIQGDHGVYLEVASDPGFELALESLDRRDRSNAQRNIELVAVREQAETMFATVFVPEGKLEVLEKLVTDYLTKETPPSARSPEGNPRNKLLVESVALIRRAVIGSFWTDDASVFPQSNEAIWWEVWVRVGSERGALLEAFSSFARRQGLRLGETRLDFPDRTVCLAYGTPAQLMGSVELLDCVGELRKAKDMASFFTEMPRVEEAAWAASMVKGIVAPGPKAPAVCILDSGVTRGHPLIASALSETDLHTYDQAWGTADDRRWRGHGTNMAGLALHGDLTEALADTGECELEHRLESVKILPPTGFPENEHRLFGDITQYATGLPEIAAPERERIFALAVTAADYRDRGSPSSWSAEIDRLAFGDEGEGQRLFIVAAGNIDDPEQWQRYPDSNDVEQVHDPGQAWNAVTVGAYTEKVLLDPVTYPDWTPVAQAGMLSPSSTTSVSWSRTWPHKPDVVLEGGNAARNPATGEVDAVDDLALLTTHFQPTERLFVPTGDTSAATAQAARFGAIIRARYPGLWPETVRGLLVHSAEWTRAMVDQVAAAQPGRRYELLLQRYGWGVPSLERACWSASNALTLVVQEDLQPYGEPKGGTVPTLDMHIHSLPWPREQLEQLFDTQVRLRVTLSYFVEPNPARRGFKYRHLYSSHGLRFEVPRPNESLAAFRARISKAAQQHLQGEPDFKKSKWAVRGHRGSLHSDWWEGSAADLANRGYVAIFPVSGWWKERPSFGRWQNRVRYSLIVSIHAPEVGIDIYSPVASKIAETVAVLP